MMVIVPRRNDLGHEDLPEVNATFFGGITQFGNVLDYAKYLADTTDDNENTFKMFAAQLYALGHINSYKNLHMRSHYIFWCSYFERTYHYHVNDLGANMVSPFR